MPTYRRSWGSPVYKEGTEQWDPHYARERLTKGAFFPRSGNIAVVGEDLSRSTRERSPDIAEYESDQGFIERDNTEDEGDEAGPASQSTHEQGILSEVEDLKDATSVKSESDADSEVDSDSSLPDVNDFTRSPSKRPKVADSDGEVEESPSKRRVRRIVEEPDPPASSGQSRRSGRRAARTQLEATPPRAMAVGTSSPSKVVNKKGRQVIQSSSDSDSDVESDAASDAESDAESEDFYEVEKIVEVKYLVRWKRFGANEDTWESYDVVKDLAALDVFEKEQAKPRRLADARASRLKTGRKGGDASSRKSRYPVEISSGRSRRC